MTDTHSLIDAQTLTDMILAEDTRLHRLIGQEIMDAKQQLTDRTGDTSARPLLIAALERVSRKCDPSVPAARLRAQRIALTMLNKEAA